MYKYKKSDYLTLSHQIKNISRLLIVHISIILWFIIGYDKLPMLWYVLFSVPICLVHQRELSEWLHEASHWNLVKNKKWNDIFGNTLAGYWFGLTMKSYRLSHFEHHKSKIFFVDTDPDTGYLNVSSNRELVKAVMGDLTGINAAVAYLKFLVRDGDREHKRVTKTKLSDMLFMVAMHLLVFSFLLLAKRWDIYLVYYLNLLTVYKLMSRIRTYGQHMNVDDAGRGHLQGSCTSRTTNCGIIDRVFVTSELMLFHYEHHKHPGLPYRALKKMCSMSQDLNRHSSSRLSVLKPTFGLKNV